MKWIILINPIRADTKAQSSLLYEKEKTINPKMDFLNFCRI